MSAPTLCSSLHGIRAERKAKVSARVFQLLARPSRQQYSKSTLHHMKLPTPWINSYFPVERTRDPSRFTHPPDENTPHFAEVIKRNMRAVRYPVSIITSTDPAIDREGGLETWKGATVASLNTVCMKPQAMVSFNMHQRSSTLRAIQNSGYFAVHILSNSPSAAELADIFSKPNEGSPFELALKMPRSLQSQKEWYFLPEKNKAMANPRILPPRLQIHHSRIQPRAVLFTLLCHISIERPIPVGDHVIVIGKVIHILPATRANKGFVNGDAITEDMMEEEDNLTYQHGRYQVKRNKSLQRLKNIFEIKRPTAEQRLPPRHRVKRYAVTPNSQEKNPSENLGAAEGNITQTANEATSPIDTKSI